MVNSILKRLMDIFGAVFGLIILSPLFLIVAIAIKKDSKGSVFFKQERLTKNGKRFYMYKFRTMVTNAESMGTGLFNFKDDPRVTRVGRFLRDSSIDELPQLINVLRGEMSLVGPRPPVTYELGDYDTLNKTYKKRFDAKAGMTGLSQVEGRNDIEWNEKIKYDNIYVDKFKKQGIWIDIVILFKTFIGVFKKENIYENKIDDTLDDAEAARLAEMEIIRIAHLPDDEFINID